MFGWLTKLFRRRKPLDEATTTLIDPIELDTVSAAHEVLKAIQKVRGTATSLPANLDELRDAIWAKLPEVIRDKDTAENRAEIAAVLQAALLLHERTRAWMAS